MVNKYELGNGGKKVYMKLNNFSLLLHSYFISSLCNEGLAVAGVEVMAEKTSELIFSCFCMDQIFPFT